MSHQISLTDSIASSMLEDSRPQCLLRPVDLAVEVVSVSRTKV